MPTSPSTISDQLLQASEALNLPELREIAENNRELLDKLLAEGPLRSPREELDEQIKLLNLLDEVLGEIIKFLNQQEQFPLWAVLKQAKEKLQGKEEHLLPDTILPPLKTIIEHLKRGPDRLEMIDAKESSEMIKEIESLAGQIEEGIRLKLKTIAALKLVLTRIRLNSLILHLNGEKPLFSTQSPSPITNPLPAQPNDFAPPRLLLSIMPSGNIDSGNN